MTSAVVVMEAEAIGGLLKVTAAVEVGGGGVWRWWKLVLIGSDGGYFGCESNKK